MNRTATYYLTTDIDWARNGGMRVTMWRARPARVEGDFLAVPGQIMGRGPSGGVLVACGSGVVEVQEAMLEDGAPLPAANRYCLPAHAS